MRFVHAIKLSTTIEKRGDAILADEWKWTFFSSSFPKQTDLQTTFETGTGVLARHAHFR